MLVRQSTLLTSTKVVSWSSCASILGCEGRQLSNMCKEHVLSYRIRTIYCHHILVLIRCQLLISLFKRCDEIGHQMWLAILTLILFTRCADRLVCRGISDAFDTARCISNLNRCFLCSLYLQVSCKHDHEWSHGANAYNTSFLNVPFRMILPWSSVGEGNLSLRSASTKFSVHSTSPMISRKRSAIHF